MDDAVGVHLDDDYYAGPYFTACTHKLDEGGNWPVLHGSGYDYHEVPREQLARWEAAMKTYQGMQDEIHELRTARAGTWRRG